MIILKDLPDRFGVIPELIEPSPWTGVIPTDEHLLEMYKLMIAEEGIGLAAPQIGIRNRYFVMHEGLYPDRFVVNPKIIGVSGAAWDVEACLSFPGRHFMVCRPTGVLFSTQNGKGTLEDWAARVFMHEYDHLDGKVLTDHQEI